MVLERLGLGNGAREAVEQCAALGVGLLEALLDSLMTRSSETSEPRVEDRRHRTSERRIGLNGRAQDVTGRDMRD
jgi:hypothetical protein